MTTYVDDARERYGLLIMCHMVADTIEELHAFAEQLGLKRKWFHDGHYNIGQDKRRAAIGMGAIAITRREAVRHRWRLELEEARRRAAPDSAPLERVARRKARAARASSSAVANYRDTPTLP